jgi:hypothetical protein
MSFRQLETDFQRKLNEYKSTFQDYLVELKNQSGTYWNTEENVTVSNRIAGAQIPFLTDPDISKDECLHACSSDPNCKYVLFSDSGNGECAANQCLKWTQDAKGLTGADSKPQFYNIFVGNSNSNTKTVTLPASGITVYPAPTNPQDPGWNNTFKVSVQGSQLSVTRTDKNTGWGQMLQLQGVKDSAGFKAYTITVGSSSANPKVVTLPENGLVVNPEPINAQNPNWGNTFNVSVSSNQLTVTRTDENSGWGQDLQLRAVKGNSQGFLMDNKACASGQGPAQTNYVYSGWEKPSWQDSNNVSFMGDPNTANPTQWKTLGTSKDLLACKDMSLSSANGPFSSVVFVNNANKCYGGVAGVQNQSLKMEGVYSSVPPLGSTSLGGTSADQYVEKLRILNAELKNDLQEMCELMDKMDKEDAKVKPVLERTHQNIRTDYKKLNNDRAKLDSMAEELQSLDVKLGILDKVGTREKMIYMGSAFFMLLLLAFIIRKSS